MIREMMVKMASFTCKTCGMPIFKEGEMGTCLCPTLVEQIGFEFTCNTCDFNKPVFGDPCCRLPSKGGCLDCTRVTAEQKAVLEEYKEAQDEVFAGFPDITDDIMEVLDKLDKE